LISAVQQILFDILNSIMSIPEKEVVRNIYYLYADFIRTGVFSFEQYLDSLVSRGLTNDFANTLSFHRECVRNFPLDRNASTYLRTQRKIALYGSAFSRNKELKQQEETIDNYTNKLIKFIESTDDMSDSDNSLLDTIATIKELPLSSTFAISDRVYNFVTSLIESGRSNSAFTEYTFMNIILIFTEFGDYRQLQDFLSCITEHNANHGEDSIWLGYEPLICRVVLDYLSLYVATDRAQFVSKLFLNQCKKDSKQSLLDTRKRKVVEDYLKLAQAAFPEVFKFDGYKRDFPHLTMFLDGIPTTPTPNYNSQTDIEDVAPISPTIQLSASSLAGLFMEHLKQYMKQDNNIGSLQSISTMLTSFLEKHQNSLSSVVFGSRKEIYPLLTYCLEHFRMDDPYVISILREMMFTGCYFNNNELYDMLCHVTGERFMNIFNGAESAIQMSQFLITCITRDLLSYDILANGIMRSLFGQVLKKLLTVLSSDQSDISTSLFGAALTTLWLARTVLANDSVIGSSNCPKLKQLMEQVKLSPDTFSINLSETDQTLFLNAKKNCNAQQIPNFTKIIGDFCYRTVQRQNGDRCPPKFNDLSDAAMELYDSFISRDEILASLSCRMGVLRKCTCEVIYERFPSATVKDVSVAKYESSSSTPSYRQVALTSIMYHTLRLIIGRDDSNIRKDIANYFIMPQQQATSFSLPTIENAIQFMQSLISSHKTWNFWHNAFFLDSFLFHMKKKIRMEQADVERLNKSLLEPLLQTGTSEHEKAIYAYTLLHQVKHSAKLKDYLKDHFFTMLVKIHAPQVPLNTCSKEDTDQWINGVTNLAVILTEMSRTDVTSAEQSLYKLCGCISQLLRSTDNMRIFEMKLEHAGLWGVQHRLTACLKVLYQLIVTSQLFNPAAKPRPPSSQRSAVMKVAIDTCFSAIDHKLSQVCYSMDPIKPMNGVSTSIQITELLRQILNELQEKVTDLQTDDQHKIRTQISDACATKLSSPQFTSKMSNVLSFAYAPKKVQTGETWSLIEDYLTSCSTCRAIHGAITPNIFNGTRVLQRGNHMYHINTAVVNQGLVFTSRSDNKRKRETPPGSDGIPHYSSPSPVRSPRNGAIAASATLSSSSNNGRPSDSSNSGDYGREAKKYRPNSTVPPPGHRS
jgi:hypothetical protein